MADLITASDAILGKLKTTWDSDTAAVMGYVPHLVFEYVEPDLKPHPRDTGKAWARAVIRHGDSGKASLRNSDQVSRFRRYGMVWVQVFVPATFGSAWTKAQQLAIVAQSAYEGKRAGIGDGESVVFTSASVNDKPRDGAWVRYDVLVKFYWDEIK